MGMAITTSGGLADTYGIPPIYLDFAPVKPKKKNPVVIPGWRSERSSKHKYQRK
jgi:hypothetical protein